MGMNSAGVTLAHCKPAGPLPRHQRPSTQAVTHSWLKAPAPHSHSAPWLGPNCATATVASKMVEAGSVATKVCRTGWRRSSAQASGWRTPRSTVATARRPNTNAASAPTSSAISPAASPIKASARCQARARPHKPMVMAYQPGIRNFRGWARWGMGSRLQGKRWMLAGSSMRRAQALSSPISRRVSLR